MCTLSKSRSLFVRLAADFTGGQCSVFSVGFGREFGEFQNLRLSVDCCLDSLEVDLTDGLNHPYCWPNSFMIIYGMHTIH